MKIKKTKMCTLRIEPELLEQLGKLAKEKNITRSNIIRQALFEKVDNEKLLTSG